jgi:hypothetical protein
MVPGKATVGTNPAARADAIDRVEAILKRHLGENSLAEAGSTEQSQIPQETK